ncbi:MAG: PIN domain-containing protein [Azospirillum sp.]|nr:PIN domain-containing protein [Azospirillum sp.]
MKIIADTNLLVRAAVRDDPAQTALAEHRLLVATLVAVPLPVLCEFVWVLARGYRRPAFEIARAIRLLIAGETVRTDRAAVNVGLRFLEAGGDFADGVIAFEGRRLGGEIFVSFDRAAVIMEQCYGGGSAELPEP